MNRKDASVHFHIRWKHIPALDWESFSTKVLAEAAANLIARTGEKYTIEKHGEKCQRCREGAKTKSIGEFLPTSPITLRCPLCGARPGHDCKTSSAIRLDVVHLSRVKAATKMDNKDGRRT
jgi:hypothetical protein